MDLTFKKATISNLEELLKLLEKSKQGMYDNGINQWNENYPQKLDIESDILKDSLHILMDDRDKIVSACSIDVEENQYRINRVMTDPETVGKGYATRLLKEIENQARLNDIESLYSSTSEFNLPMKKVFKKNGFLQISEYIIKERKEAGVFGIYQKYLL